jgi:hypothetical protein
LKINASCQRRKKKKKKKKWKLLTYEDYTLIQIRRSLDAPDSLNRHNFGSARLQAVAHNVVGSGSGFDKLYDCWLKFASI